MNGLGINWQVLTAQVVNFIILGVLVLAACLALWDARRRGADWWHSIAWALACLFFVPFGHLLYWYWWRPKQSA